jgi:hypothetical protein
MYLGKNRTLGWRRWDWQWGRIRETEAIKLGLRRIFSFFVGDNWEVIDNRHLSFNFLFFQIDSWRRSNDLFEKKKKKRKKDKEKEPLVRGGESAFGRPWAEP